MSIKEDAEDALWRKLRKDNPIKALRKDLAVNWKDKDCVHVRDDGTKLEAKEYSIQFVCRGELPIYAENELEARKIAEDIIDFLEIEEYRFSYILSLPYGIQKRVELARALAMKPEVILLDEPAAGMLDLFLISMKNWG